MSRIYIRKPRKIRCRGKYGRDQSYIGNNKIYFGGKTYRGRDIGQAVVGLLSNLVKGVIGGIRK